MNPKNQEKIDDWWKRCIDCSQKCMSYTSERYPICSRCVNKSEKNSIDSIMKMLNINT